MEIEGLGGRVVGDREEGGKGKELKAKKALIKVQVTYQLYFLYSNPIPFHSLHHTSNPPQSFLNFPSLSHFHYIP